MRALRIIGACVLVAGFAVWLTSLWIDRYMARPLPLTAPLTFVVQKGSTLSAVARDLETRGALPHARLWKWRARRLGLARSIHAGEYQIDPGMTPDAVLRMLVKGAVILREITIVEGSTFRELLRSLAAHPSISHTLGDADGAAIMARIGAPGIHPEGQFFPDTYRFATGTSDVELLKQAHGELRRRLAGAWQSRNDQLPLAGEYEALILASIVEKESALPAERARIAGVFVRRLRIGMRLQSDPTVIYGLGETYGGNIRRRDLHADTAYNTYTRAGLPPTPIALPGEGSLRAAAQPDDTGALYFVATGEPDGSHYFSSTLSEHNAAVRRFLARMRARNAGAQAGS